MRENARVSNPYAPPDPTREAPASPPAGPSHPRAPHGPTPAGVPGHPGPRPAPTPRPVDEALAARAAWHARLFGLLVLSSLLVSTLPLPWQAASLVFALVGLVVGGRALQLALRSGARGSLPAALGLGVAVAFFWSFVTAGMLLLWPVQVAHQECVAGALTVSARHACEQQYEQDLKDWQSRLEQRAATA